MNDSLIHFSTTTTTYILLSISAQALHTPVIFILVDQLAIQQDQKQENWFEESNKIE